MIAIETHRKEDDTKWLTYWVVFSAFSVAELFSDFLLNWIPFYWLIKCLFLLWCSVPSSNSGSHLIYHKFLCPVFLKNYAAINETLDKAASGAAGLLMEASSKVVSSGKTD
nr:putative receptor accessory protein 5 [Physocyclus mexicanus]